jgi:transposase
MLYQTGKSISEIAQTRNLAESTISSHLGKFIVSGELDIDVFLSEKKRALAHKTIEESEEIGSVFQILKGTLTQSEISFYVAWLRKTDTVKANEFTGV